MRHLFLILTLTLFGFPQLAQAQPVLRTETGICHCPGGSYYDDIKNAAKFDDIQSCLAAGGREPKRGQGNCSASSVGESARPARAANVPNPTVLPQTPMTGGYKREAFGDGWLDFDGDCMNTRNEILASLSTGQVTLTGSGCAVVTGRWNDPYTGKIFTNPRDMDIDHIVPLSFAWKHGADQWSTEKRQKFANDPVNLISVDGPTNRQKSDDGPLKWLPPNLDYRCEYTLRFIRISKIYGLTFGAQEAQDMSDLTTFLCR